jgi:hypothetical protein
MDRGAPLHLAAVVDVAIGDIVGSPGAAKKAGRKLKTGSPKKGKSTKAR